MPTLTPTTTGLLFVRGVASCGRTSAGEPQITIPAAEDLGHGQKTRWLLTHKGAEAAAFWLAHKDQLKPGQPITATVTRHRVVNGEIVADVQTITLAPRAAHCARDAQAA